MKRLKQFLKWMRGYKFVYLISILLLISLQYFRTLSPLFITHIIDNIIGESSVSVLPGFISNLFSGDTQNQKLLNTLYQKLQNLSFSYHTHAETGDLIQRCTTDVETYRVFIGEQLIEIFRLVFLISLTAYQMARMNVTLTLYSLIVGPIIFFASFIYFIYVKKVFKKVEEAEAVMTTTLQESVTGIRVVKAFAKEKYEIDKFDEHSKKYLKEDYRLLKLMAIFWGGTDFVIFIQYAITTSMGILFHVNGLITIGEFIAFLSFIGMIVWPMRQLGRIVGDFGKTTVALDRLDEIVLKESEHYNDSDNEPTFKGAVEFKNVGFQFDDDNKPLLKNISFKVNKGESVAIVGKTGSGKSTLINLMIRLLDIQEGSIMFDGTDIKDINKKFLRKHVGIIMQEPFLYSRTLYDNIGIMDQNASEEKVYKAASIAALHDDIIGFESGYKTIVGERGVTLSGGQKQRVAIARMLLDSKPVLIFDDSLSAVDTETDIQIRRALNDYWKNTTVFIITHRITTAMEADKIIVLDKGEIVEMGTHTELLEKDGIYNELWDIQTNVEYDYIQSMKGVK
jgi:ATP-binding cassette subfamily B protein